MSIAAAPRAALLRQILRCKSSLLTEEGLPDEGPSESRFSNHILPNHILPGFRKC